MWRVALFMTFAVATASAGEPALLDSPAFDRTFWTVVRVQDVPVDAAEGREILANINRATLTFGSPCATRSFPITQKQLDLTLHPAWRKTGGRCNAGEERAIELIETLMPAARRSTFDGINLLLADSDNRPLAQMVRFASKTVENRHWTIASYFDGKRLTSLRLDRGASAEIAFIHGVVEGTPGCGALIGSYELRDQKLVINAGVLLRGHCPGGAFEQSKSVTEALNGDRFVEIAGHLAYLRDDRGSVRIVLSTL
jgi:heat shock protein HslJ